MTSDLQEVIKELKERSNGKTLRVPLPDQSLIEQYEADLGMNFSDDYELFLREASIIFLAPFRRLSLRPREPAVLSLPLQYCRREPLVFHRTGFQFAKITATTIIFCRLATFAIGPTTDRIPRIGPTWQNGFAKFGWVRANDDQSQCPCVTATKKIVFGALSLKVGDG